MTRNPPDLSTKASVEKEATTVTPTLQGLEAVLKDKKPEDRTKKLSKEHSLLWLAKEVSDHLGSERCPASVYFDFETIQLVSDSGENFFGDFVQLAGLPQVKKNSLIMLMKPWFAAEQERMDAVRWKLGFANAKVTTAIRTTQGSETTTKRTTISVGELSHKMDLHRNAHFSAPRQMAITEARNDPALHAIVAEEIGDQGRQTNEAIKYTSAIYAITGKVLQQSATEANNNRKRDQREPEVNWTAADEIPTNNGEEGQAVHLDGKWFAVPLADGTRFVIEAGSAEEAMELCGVPKKNKPEGNHHDKEKRKEGSASAAAKEDQNGLLLQLENGQMALASGIDCAKALQKLKTGPATDDAPTLTLADIFSIHEAMLTAAAFAAGVSTPKIKEFLAKLQSFAAGRRIAGEDDDD